MEELTEIFSPHGDIVRLLLPPAGTIAVVEFSNASEASKAFKSIAYRRLKNSIIYLEKAPLGIFKEGDPGTTKSRRLASGVKPVTDPANSKVVPAPEDTASADDSPSTTTAVAGATLFVKNLSFATTSEKLTKTFRHLASFAFARVQIRPDPKKPGSTLSMGYGFVGFKDKKSAEMAMGSISGFVLDGHELSAKFAQRGAEDDAKSASLGPGAPKTPTTKMIVKNLPFEATKKDVQTLFRYVSVAFVDVVQCIIANKDSCLIFLVLTDNSNPYDCPRNSTLVPEDSLSSSSSLIKRPSMRTMHSSIPICSDDM